MKVMKMEGLDLKKKNTLNHSLLYSQHLYSFILSDYLPWMRVFDLEGHEKLISDAIRTVSKYHDPIIEERIQQRSHHHGNYKKGSDDHQDLLDALISAN